MKTLGTKKFATKAVSKEFVTRVDKCFKRVQSNLVNFNRHALKYFTWYFDNPQKDYKIVHVAGSNGKGSVSLKTAALLEKSGFKTGLFVSPHISSVRERIQVNRQKIPESDFIKHYDKLERFEREWEIDLGCFQFLLGMALNYFKEQECDFAVLECGIGGWSSQTNIADANYAVITSIGLEHCDILGKSEARICRDKAGILRENIPLVVGPTVPLDVIQPICKHYNSKLICIQPKDESFITCNKEISLAVYNEILNNEPEIPIKLSEEEIQEALDVTPPCRMDLVPVENIKEFAPDLDYYPKHTYMDVGHNAPAMKGMLNTLEKLHSDNPKLKVYVIACFSSNKDILPALNTLMQRAVDIRIVLVKHYRLITEKEADEVIQKLKMSGLVKALRIHDIEHKGDLTKNVRATLEMINRKEEENAVLMV